MAETLKKYRVKTVDGKVHIIEAKNIHDAQSKARLDIGQLPNDINLKIVDKVLAELQNDLYSIKEVARNLKNESKNLNWDEVHTSIKELSEHMMKQSTSLKQLAGSMAKIKNDKEV
jgi:septation ring formation regulator EzrA